MTTLHLHVGHGKTGSSFIQSSLALSAGALRKQGIHYPKHRSHESAQRGGISSGNGGLLFDQTWKPGRLAQPDHWLFSDENLFQRLITPDFIDRLERRKQQLKVQRTRILLYIRDPVDHAQSAYQQSIKRGGRTWSLDEFFAQYRMPRMVLRFLQACEADHTEVTVQNYSRSQGALLDQVQQWLGAGIELKVPPRRIVNRSLTRAEIAVQMELNRYLDKTAHFVADALCEQLPDVTAERLIPEAEIQQAMLTRLADAIEAVNRQLPAAAQYSTQCLDPTLPPSDQDTHQLSGRQLQVIAATLGEKISELKSRLG